MFFQRICPGCRQGGRGLCGRCLTPAQAVGVIHGLTGLDHVAAAFRYEGAVKRMLLAGKNSGRRDILKGFAPRLAGLAMRSTVGFDLGFDIVSWVPASRDGLRRRGYDQGAVLARAVAAELSVPCRRLLVRGRGEQQTGRSRAERSEGPRLRVVRACPQRILLVDDVITTGASVAAAGGAVLARSGARCVGAVAVAWHATEREARSGRPLGAGYVRSP